MAYKEVKMWEILDVLRRCQAGDSQRRIQATTSLARKTIRRYVRIAKSLGWDPQGADVPTEELAAQVYQELKPGPRMTSVQSVDARLLPHLEQIKNWVVPENGNRGLQFSKVHVLLQRKGVKVTYISLYRFIMRHCEVARRKCTVRMADTEPGEYVEVDFGRLGLVGDAETGKNRVTHALVVTMVHSRHQYVHITQGQGYKDLVDGLEEAWQFFGGVPQKAIIDNMKAAVLKADRYNPVFQRMFSEYASYRGFIIDAAVAGQPKGKPHVERAVPYVRENFFRGEEWLNKEHVQREAIRWCLDRAGMRIHGTTRQRPLEVFNAEERKSLVPIEKERYDPPRWAECKVHIDHHIRLSYAFYSVPTKYLGQMVDVREDSKIVRIYFKGLLIKTHPRKGQGQKSTDADDYPKEVSAYAMRDPNRMIGKARKLGKDSGDFMKQLLSGMYPWAKLRQAQMLLRLAQKYGSERIDSACARALQFQNINVYAVKTIIEDNLDNQTKGRQGRLFQSPPTFLRPPGSFSPERKGQKERIHAGC